MVAPGVQAGVTKHTVQQTHDSIRKDDAAGAKNEQSSSSVDPKKDSSKQSWPVPEKELGDEISTVLGHFDVIFPKKGDIWALYQNWSPDWDQFTADDMIYNVNYIPCFTYIVIAVEITIATHAQPFQGSSYVGGFQV
ncbi:hypothetical protein ACJX0J_035630 [Zea mays]